MVGSVCEVGNCLIKKPVSIFSFEIRSPLLITFLLFILIQIAITQNSTKLYEAVLT